MKLIVSLLVVASCVSGFQLARPVRKATLTSSRSSGQLWAPLRQTHVELQMATGSTVEKAKNKIADTAVLIKTKVELIIKLVLSPVLRFFTAVLKALNRLLKVGSKTIQRTANGSLPAFETPITIAAIKPKSSFSVSALKNLVKKGNSENAAKDYVREKLREIEAAERAATKADKKGPGSGRWPPIITTPPPSGTAKKSVASLKKADLMGKRVLVRCDLNVPLDANKQVTDDTRLRGCTSTIEYLKDNGAKVLLTSHLGRPKGNTPEDRAKFSLAPVVPRLSELLKADVKLVEDCIGPAVEDAVSHMSNGDVILLENSRFYKEEEGNDKGFCNNLSKNVDIFVNDAFGTAHRAHATTAGVTNYVKPSVAGFLLQKELDYLQGAVDVPKRPFAAIVGGSKVSSKISVIEAMLNKVDKLILGGGMVFTFLKARGVPVGASLVENDQLDLARRLEKIAKAKGVELFLATDVVVADKFAADAQTKVVNIGDIPYGWMGLDIGPKTLDTIVAGLSDCQTVIWNGPMGVFEMDAFAKGTFGVANALADLTSKGCTTIIGGGDSVAAVEKAGLASKMSHISTGGGASLELLEGKVLPGVSALDKA